MRTAMACIVCLWFLALLINCGLHLLEPNRPTFLLRYLPPRFQSYPKPFPTVEFIGYMYIPQTCSLQLAFEVSPIIVVTPTP